MTSNKSLHTALPFAILLFLSLLDPLSSKDLKVHIIVNSHMDLGWYNTINEYFTGSGCRYGENVKRMLDNVIGELWNHKNRTYAVAELGFLDLWWRSQSEEERGKAYSLIQEGRLEIVNGGWVGNDEACSMYDDIIQNFIIGQRWTNQNLNYTNTSVGWQMDSFGTSVAQAYLLKEAGYEAMFFSRVDNAERQRRKDSQSLEFNWQFPNSDDSIFTHLMSRMYSTPPLPRAEYISQVFTSGYVRPEDLEAINDTVWQDHSYYKTDHVFLLFCGDFYMSGRADIVYNSLDMIIDYFDSHPNYGLDVFYSTPGRYIKEVKEELAAQSTPIANKEGDFFPLNERPGTVWSGYFTSKSNFKALIRWHSRYLTAVKLLTSQKAMQRFNVSDTPEDAALYEAITNMEKALAIVQHHDSVTGTMREHVRFDYEDILSKARRNLADRISEVLLSGLKSNQTQEAIVNSMNITYDSLLGGLTSPEMSTSTLSEDNELLLAVMNPGNKQLFLLTANLTSVPKDDICITVETSDGRTISPDIICQEDTGCAVYFADTIEAYSFMYYQIKATDEDNESCGYLVTSEEVDSEILIESPHWVLLLEDGNLFTFTSIQDDTVQKQFRFSYSYYESSLEDKGNHHASGAYIFRPRSVDKKILSTENQTTLWIGEHVALIQIQSANFTTTIQLLIKQEEFGFSVITQLKPIINATNGCEIILEIDVPELQSDGKFFTDTNGYFMLERPYVPAESNETAEDEITKNYHPMTTRCSLEGNHGTEAFTVFTDRAQGVSIQKDNQINIMLHRVAVMDDDEGVSEVLNETYAGTSQPVAVTTWHYFLWSNISSKQESRPVREETQYVYERPLHIWQFSVNKVFSLSKINQNNQTSLDLPTSLKLNMRTYTQNEHFIRLQNLDPNNDLSIVLSSADDKSPSLLTFLSQNPQVRPQNISETTWTTVHTIQNSSNFDVNGTITLNLAPLQMRTLSISFMDAPDSTEMVAGNHDLGGLDNDDSQVGFPWYGYYLCVHGCVAFIYLLLCIYRANQRGVSIGNFKQEICIVICLGPFGIGVLFCMNKSSSSVADYKASGDMKTELLKNQTSETMAIL